MPVPVLTSARLTGCAPAPFAAYPRWRPDREASPNVTRPWSSNVAASAGDRWRPLATAGDRKTADLACAPREVPVEETTQRADHHRRDPGPDPVCRGVPILVGPRCAAGPPVPGAGPRIHGVRQ